MSTPVVTVVNVIENVQVHAAVEGATELPLPYDRKGGKFRPAYVSVRYYRADGGEWKAERPKVRGPKIKKDGTDSSNQGESGYGSDLPEWVAEFVRQNTPGGES